MVLHQCSFANAIEPWRICIPEDADEGYPISRWMKAHIVTHNLFSHTFDHAVNGNTLILIKIFFFLYSGYFFNYNRVCQQFRKIEICLIGGFWFLLLITPIYRLVQCFVDETLLPGQYYLTFFKSTMIRTLTVFLLLLCLNLTTAQTTPTPTPVAEKVLAALVRVFFLQNSIRSPGRKPL